MSKVVVNGYISNTPEYLFSGPSNSTITITDLNPIFTFPISVASWGKNFLYSSTPTQYRYVGLFNQTSCRLDYDDDARILTFINATPTNLGCPATNNLPEEETLVAKILLTYKLPS